MEDSAVFLIKGLIEGNHLRQDALLEGQRSDGSQKPAVSCKDTEEQQDLLTDAFRQTKWEYSGPDIPQIPTGDRRNCGCVNKPDFWTLITHSLCSQAKGFLT